MTEASFVPPTLSILAAQDAIAATIPEIEKIAWQCFTISRDLGLPEGEDFPVERPSPERLRWWVSLSAGALYEELQEWIVLARRAAQQSEDSLAERFRNEIEEAARSQETGRARKFSDG